MAQFYHTVIVTFFLLNASGMSLGYTSQSISDGQSVASKGGVTAFVVHSYPAGQWTQRLEAGLQASFANQQVRLALHTYTYQNYEAQRSWYQRTAQLVEKDAMTAAILQHNPDVIIVTDDEALSAYGPFLQKFDRPLFFTGINARKNKVAGLGQQHRKITGVFERYPKAKSLRLLSDLTKDQVRSIAIITDDSLSSRHILDEFVGFFAQKTTKIKLGKVYVLAKINQWPEALDEINAEYDAFWLLLPFDVHDARDQRVPPQRVLQTINDYAKIPSLAIIDIARYPGAMAAISVQPEGLGHEVGDMILEAYLQHWQLPPPRPYDRGQIMINLRATDSIGIRVPIEILEYAKVIQ
jgi:ABC-type uncharacterized transport system substrate-binding protein